jgi:hypothetical protein
MARMARKTPKSKGSTSAGMRRTKVAKKAVKRPAKKATKKKK